MDAEPVSQYLYQKLIQNSYAVIRTEKSTVLLYL